MAVALTGNVAHEERRCGTAASGQVETLVARTGRRAVVRIGGSAGVRGVTGRDTVRTFVGFDDIESQLNRLLVVLRVHFPALQFVRVEQRHD